MPSHHVHSQNPAVKGFGPWNLANESHPIKLNELQANSWRWTCWCFGLEFCVWWFLCLEIVVGCSMIVHQAELPPKNPGKNHCHFCLGGSWILSSEVQNYTWTKSQWSFFLVIQVIMSHHESSSPWFKATAWDATPASGEVTSRRVPIGLVTLRKNVKPEKITTCFFVKNPRRGFNNVGQLSCSCIMVIRYVYIYVYIYIYTYIYIHTHNISCANFGNVFLLFRVFEIFRLHIPTTVGLIKKIDARREDLQPFASIDASQV